MENDAKIFGFWIYLMTDLILFSVLFATFIVLQGSTFGGPSAQELFSLPYALNETLILLTASFIIGLGGVAAHRKNKKTTLFLFSLAFLLGIIFFSMQLGEFYRLIEEGNSWKKSAFLSADRKSTRLNSSHSDRSRMPSSA